VLSKLREAVADAAKSLPDVAIGLLGEVGRAHRQRRDVGDRRFRRRRDRRDRRRDGTSSGRASATSTLAAPSQAP
jgi:hypothetical protein